MHFFNLSWQILNDMWQRKMRSLLALFGIIWGTFIVVMLLALSTGFSNASEKNMLDIVDGAFFIITGHTSLPFHGLPKGQIINIKAQAVMDIKKRVPTVFKASPFLENQASINSEKNNIHVIGISNEYDYLRKIYLENGGRFINILDLNSKHHVAIIGDKLKNRIFKNVDNKAVIGQTIKINDIPFMVIGVIGKSIYSWHRNDAIIPYTTYNKIFGDQNTNFFIVLPNRNADPRMVAESVRNYFSHKYNFLPNDRIALNIIDTTETYQMVRTFFTGLRIFFIICGALALGVGSLGVANIMFLIVIERTREIGLRLALGASNRSILGQIILEACFIVATGGFIGFIFSYLTNSILQLIRLPEWLGIPVITTSSVIITITVLGIFGLLAGYFPARRAANMDPVVALRH